MHWEGWCTIIGSLVRKTAEMSTWLRTRWPGVGVSPGVPYFQRVSVSLRWEANTYLWMSMRGTSCSVEQLPTLHADIKNRFLNSPEMDMPLKMKRTCLEIDVVHYVRFYIFKSFRLRINVAIGAIVCHLRTKRRIGQLQLVRERFKTATKFYQRYVDFENSKQNGPLTSSQVQVVAKFRT